MGQPYFRLKGFLKVLHSFLFLKPERHYVKIVKLYIRLLLRVITVYCVKYLSLSLSLCPSKIQVIQHWALDFAYVNNYLAFKFSAWRSFTISFELKCHGLHRYYLGRFLPSSCKIYQGKLKLEPSNSLHIFEGSLNFPTIFTFKVLQLLYDCCNFSITMKMCCAMQ